MNKRDLILIGIIVAVIAAVCLTVFLTKEDGACVIVRIDGMDKGIMDSARAMNLSNTSMILEILFPYAFAGVVGSLKVTFTTGIMLLTFAEMMGATSGMGYYIVNYNTYGNYTKVVAGIIVVGTVVTVLNKCIDVLQKKLIVWEM